MKTKSESKYFWTRIEEGLHEKGITLAELCRQQGVNYDSIISSKMRLAIPAAVTVLKIAQALHVSMESLLTDESVNSNLFVAESQPAYREDPLYELLSENPSLKAMAWRIVECNAIQLRTIGTLLNSWGIRIYNERGEFSKQLV
ncbi:MAG: hypothetical protein EOM62_18350 [Bacteroidia bacterium]|nr:hypothetical protein [Bacteroidia bacterium]